MDTCELCHKFDGTPKPDSSLKKCINPKCTRPHFNLTPVENIFYYLYFLRKTLCSEIYRQLLKNNFSSRFSRNCSYYKAWESFIDEVYNNRDNLDISRVGVYYAKGIGIKKSSFMADLFYTLAEKYRTVSVLEREERIENKCPVCIANPDNGEGSMVCETCGNMVCQFCFKRLTVAKCPTCNEKYERDVSIRIRKLKDIVYNSQGRNIENIKVYLAGLILSNKDEPTYQAYSLLVSSIMKGCNRGYYLLGTLYMDGKGCVKDIPTAIKIFKTGIEKGQTNCMNELARLYMAGIGVKKNKNKGTELYKMAVLNGSSSALFYLHKTKL